MRLLKIHQLTVTRSKHTEHGMGLGAHKEYNIHILTYEAETETKKNGFF